MLSWSSSLRRRRCRSVFSFYQCLWMWRRSSLLLITLVTMATIGSVSAQKDFCTTVDHCDAPPPPPAPQKDQARYDHYRIYNVELATPKHIEILQQLEQQSDSLTFIGHARDIGQKLSILVAAHRIADFADLLQTYEVKHRVLTYNFQEKIDKNMREVLPIGTDVSTGFDWHHFYHLETIYAWMEHMVTQHPKDLTLLDMGTSTQGVPIKGLKLARNGEQRATIFIESGIHAREWIAPASATYLLQTLLNPGADAAIQRLSNEHNWIVFPCINPDGYKYTFEHDRMWRKNRALFGTNRGVDLNRNYPDHWNSTGCSSDPSRYDFSGPAAASEVETQRLIQFVEANVANERIRTYIALHSYSQMIMFPFGYTPERVTNYDDLQEFGSAAAARIKALSGRVYTSGSLIETIYPSSGDSMDWAYSKVGIPIAYTFELRGPPDSEDLFILPAVEILPTAQEAFVAIQAIVEGAGQKGYYDK